MKIKKIIKDICIKMFEFLDISRIKIVSSIGNYNR